MTQAPTRRCFCLEDLSTAPLEEQYKLPCGCRCHYECLVAYIQSRIRDRTQLGTTISCPYGEQCVAAPSISLTFSDLEAVASKGTALTLDDISQLQRWVQNRDEESRRFVTESDSEKARKLNSMDPYVLATTKACPSCSFRSTHYHGHFCHHIAPSNGGSGQSGCPSCHVNYCYKCLSTEVENLEQRSDPTKCKCGFWGSYCSPIRCSKDISLYIESKPVPFDRRCGCVICPDCLFNQPCESCPGNCVVCLGFLNPGPRDLDVDYKVQMPGGYFDQHAKDQLIVLLQESFLYGDIESCLRWLERRRQEGNVLDINSKNPEGRSCLHLAVMGGHYDCVSLLLEQCPEVDVNLGENDGYSPFLIACKDGFLDLVKLIAATGRVDVNHATENGYTSLFVTCCNGHADVVQFLLQHPFSPAIDVNKADHTGYVPFLMAARNGHLRIVELLLEQSTLDVIRASSYGSTALFWAEKNRHTEIAKAIKLKTSSIRSLMSKPKGCSSS